MFVAISYDDVIDFKRNEKGGGGSDWPIFFDTNIDALQDNITDFIANECRGEVGCLPNYVVFNACEHFTLTPQATIYFEKDGPNPFENC